MMKDIENYKLYLADSGRYSRTTVNNYSTWVDRWGKFAGDKAITAPLVDAYKRHLKQDCQLSDRTIAQHLIVLRLYCTWRKRVGLTTLDSQLIEIPRGYGKRKIKFLTREEIDDMIALSKDHPLDHALIVTLFSTGLRVSELANIMAEDVASKNKEIVVRGKGDKTRTAYLSTEAVKAITAYLDGREKGQVFPHSPRWVQQRIKSLGERALDKSVTPHMIRHSLATYLHSKGVSIFMIQRILGHSSVATTEIYTHITNKELKDLHSKMIK